MLQNEIKASFIELGKFLSQFSKNNTIKNDSVLNNNLFYNDFLDLIILSQSHNGWYTPENVFFAINSWSEALTDNNLNKWISGYNFEPVNPKTIGLILAGNIPLVFYLF